MVWIITIVLMSIDIYIVFMDPLERQYDLTQVVIAWYLVTLLLDFLFRHRIDEYGERLEVAARGEIAYHEVVERQGERHDKSAENAGQYRGELYLEK